VTFVTSGRVTQVTRWLVMHGTSATCRRAQDARDGDPNHRGREPAEEVKQVAEKKVTPKAAASKSTKGGAKKAAATRVTKRAQRRVSLRKQK
jgi:hypothetical protein